MDNIENRKFTTIISLFPSGILFPTFFCLLVAKCLTEIGAELSWWIVFAPFWIPWALVLGFFAFWFFIAGIFLAVGSVLIFLAMSIDWIEKKLRSLFKKIYNNRS